jgi:pimeloyl-ACP methyl ester carboxylesterase
VRYDRRGFGRSEPPKGPYSDVDDRHAVLDTLNISRAILVGCSNGSRLAVDYTLAHPDRVAALVLVGGAAGSGRVAGTGAGRLIVRICGPS